MLTAKTKRRLINALTRKVLKGVLKQSHHYRFEYIA